MAPAVGRYRVGKRIKRAAPAPAVNSNNIAVL